MIQILDSMPKKPKFLDQLMTGAQNAGQQLPGLLGNMAENQGLQRLTGQDFSGLSPEIKNTFLQKFMAKKAEDTQTKQNAIKSLGEMREIIGRGKTGLNPFTMGPEGLGERSALDTAALNLEKIAADMVGRGTLSKQRFEYLKERLPSGWKTDQQNLQIIDQWEKILGEAEMGSESIGKGRAKFNKEHPEHRAKAEQLNKKFKGDRARVRKELEREFDF
jgi:hypothetical protein